MANAASTKKFLIDFYCRTLASVGERKDQQRPSMATWKFELPGVRLFLRDSIKRVGDVNLHRGLSALVEVRANSEEEAINLAKVHGETILHLVTLSTQAGCLPTELVSALEVRGGKLPWFRQHCPWAERTEILASLAPIPQEVFGQIWEAFNRTPQKERLLRTLTWLRKGISEENGVDEFTAYWVGLEAIKNILRGKLRFRKRRPAEWDGVREIFEKDLGLTNFDDVEEARNGLLHGYRELTPEFVREVLSYVEPVRRGLIMAIGQVLELDGQVARTLSEKALRRSRQDPWTVLYGELENLPENVETFLAEYPRVEAVIRDKLYQVNQDGTVSVGMKVTQTFRGPNSVRWHLKGSELWGDRESGIKTMGVQYEDQRA